MDYNTERFQLRCAVCGRMTDVQKLDEPALCDNCSHADLREMKRQERRSSDIDAVLKEHRRV
jgi:rRNA maturation endonuclease Nob1